MACSWTSYCLATVLWETLVGKDLFLKVGQTINFCLLVIDVERQQVSMTFSEAEKQMLTFLKLLSLGLLFTLTEQY